MLEEPTIRKAGVVASQKRHLGRTIATPPLPYEKVLSTGMEVNVETGIKYYKPLVVRGVANSTVSTKALVSISERIVKTSIEKPKVVSDVGTECRVYLGEVTVKTEISGAIVRGSTETVATSFAQLRVVNARRTDTEVDMTISVEISV